MRISSWISSSGQHLTPFTTPAAQDFSPGRRPHPRSETMASFSLAPARLVGSFHKIPLYQTCFIRANYSQPPSWLSSKREVGGPVTFCTQGDMLLGARLGKDHPATSFSTDIHPNPQGTYLRLREDGELGAQLSTNVDISVENNRLTNCF